jgi:NAD(P)-dependent dehydrogenase (short-subunit alcohol dehydrogenase family)
MDETLLITGNQSPLSRSIVSRLLKEKRRVVVSVEKEAEEIIYPEAPDDRLILLEHDRRSPFSARSMFLGLTNRGISVNHVLAIHSILGTDETIQTVQSRSIEQKIDAEIKGFVFFIKEAMAYFERRNGGSVNIVLHNVGPEVPGPMDALVAGAIESVGNSLFAYYSQDNVLLRGFVSRESAVDEYSEHIFQTIAEDKPSGRWYPFRNRGRLFPFGR